VPTAELVIHGTVLTVDESQPTAEALAVAGGRITAVGSRAEIEPLIGPDTDVIDVGEGCVVPGLIEAHGHPLMEAIALSDRLADIRPVTIADADAVVAAVEAEVTKRGDDGAYLNGWDPLLQSGLPEPTLDWLNGVAPDTPLVIIHNSGHKAYFNSAAATRAGLARDTPDPTGALTTCSEMAFDPMFRPVLDKLRDQLTVRLRTYEMSTAEMSTEESLENGDDTVRQVGIKIWVDGSPWVGNIDLSFPYLDTAATRAIGVVPGSCGHANYTREQLTEIVEAYFPLGWQMACHVQGDKGVDTILDVYEVALKKHPRTDHRLRLEHVGAISDEQLERAADLGVTCSIFVDQIHYWGDIIVDGLFGAEHGSRWMPCGSAVATGMRISLHNDPPVTPEEPLRNISVAATRTAPSGRVLGPEQLLTVDQAIRAQTIDAAWQLFSDDVIGSLEVGKYADFVVLSADPRSVPAEQIADLEVRATYLAGRQVYGSG
jgi:predicted amidohydrolase YtcJ